MKSIISLSLCSAFVAFAAVAAVAADNWSGTGQLTMSGMPAMSCERVALSLDMNDSVIDLQRFDYDCSGMSGAVDPLRFDVRGSEVFLGGNKVGDRNGNVTKITLADPSGASMDLTFERMGDNQMKASQDLVAPGFSQTMEAVLTK